MINLNDVFCFNRLVFYDFNAILKYVLACVFALDSVPQFAVF
ncbi:hypothetical protein L293_3922 [Acinetobacter gyllenbergii CIP 110306 = MTCC 11365]|nr:hypothetical protein L293_3922 [Acinetobacter gyllenbergii CIP 110306 = MTCC 11365]